MATGGRLTPRTNYVRYIDFASLIALVGISLMLAAFAFSRGGVDFGVYYAAGRVAWSGGNPYDYGQLAPQIVSNAGQINNPFYYAPWFTWALMPLTLLPYEVARLVWASANFALWFLGLYNLGKLIAWPAPGWRRWGWYILMTLLFAWTVWGFEQVGLLIFFLWTVALRLLERGRWTAAGVVLAMLLFKPNITALPVAAIAAWLVLRGRWKPVHTAGLTLLIMVVASLVITPGWYRALLEPDKLTGLSHTLDAAGGTDVTRFNTTLLDWLRVHGITGNPALTLYALVCVLGVAIAALAAYRASSTVQLMAVVFAVNFAIVPYALFYDYPCLALTMFHANAIPLRRRWFVLVRNGLNVFAVLSLFIGKGISFRYWLVIALVLLLLFTYAAQRVETSSPDPVASAGAGT